MSHQSLALCGLSPEVEALRWESYSSLRIGRQSSLEVVINHPSVSRHHAEVAWRSAGWAVRDLGSIKGTTVNGAPVGRNFHNLRPNDLIRCGDVLLRAELAGTGASSSDSIILPVHQPRVSNYLPVAGNESSRSNSADHIKLSGRFVRVQASTFHSVEKAIDLVESIPHLQLGKGHHLQGLLRMGHYLRHMHSLDDLLQALLDDAVAVLDAQRGSIVLADQETGMLHLHAISFSKQALTSNKVFSRTLANHCFDEGKSLLCRDVNVERDLQHAGSIAHGAMSSIICVLLRSPRNKLGVLHLDRGPLQDPFSTEDYHLADAVAASMSYGIENALLAENQRELFVQTVTALAQAVEMRDSYTGQHTERVTQYSLMLGKEMGLPPAELNQIRMATPLHDIGKIAIDDSILRKPGVLSAGEFEEMKKHVIKGAAILEPIPAMQTMIPIVRNHHERWDGKGYPDRLLGVAIPKLARIVAVADAFDAMTSQRPYRAPMSLDQAFAELAAKAGTHFDPDSAQAFLRLRHRIEQAMSRSEISKFSSSDLTDSLMRREVLQLLNQHSGPLRRPKFP